MFQAKALEQLRGLSAAQQRRLKGYARNLSTDKSGINFDKRVRDCLRRYGKDKQWIDGTLEYLRSIGFSQSIYKFSEIKKQLHRFTEEPNHPYFGWNENFIKAKSDLIRQVSNWNLKPLVYRRDSDIARALPRTDTHAGWAYIETGVKRKGDYMDGVHSRYEYFERIARSEGSCNQPILIASRTQASGAFDECGNPTGTFRDKTRFVSIVSLWQILMELKFAKPFQEKLGSTDWYAGSKDDHVLLAKLVGTKSRYDSWLSIDYSSFDQTISNWLIHEAFDVVEQAFWEPTFDSELFSIVRHDFINKCFIDGSGHSVFSCKGVPSGSMFTQIIDSIVNNLVIRTYLNSIGISDFFMMIMGDDNIIFTDQKIDRKSLASYLSRNFGLDVGESKCKESSKVQPWPQFLSRTWTPEGVDRPVCELLAKMCYSERWRDYDGGKTNEHHIIWSYIRAFPRGMDQLIDVKEYSHDHYVSEMELSDCGEHKWMSGLMRYRLLYT